MAGVFRHAIWCGLFADEEVAALFGAERQARDMQRFEAALSRAVGAAGLVEASLAEAAADAIEAISLDIGRLSAKTAEDGLSVPELVRQIKLAVPNNLHSAVHVGSTSQDVLDTCLALAVRDLGEIFEKRFEALQSGLAEMAVAYGEKDLMARTRMQAALPVHVSDRLAIWQGAITEAGHVLDRAVRELSVVQIGGPVGTRAGFGGAADAVVGSVAEALGLGIPDRVWHADRRRVVALGDALSYVTGALGKMGQDLALMAQQGIKDVRISGGGSSSAMAHKANPIQAELLVTLARYNATQVSALHHALVHEQERSGAAWALEWMVLPNMAEAAGRALLSASLLLSQVEDMGTAKRG